MSMHKVNPLPAGRPLTSMPKAPARLPKIRSLPRDYQSIGCSPCTTLVAAGRGPAGRPLVRARQKERGIHVDVRDPVHAIFLLVIFLVGC